MNLTFSCVEVRPHDNGYAQYRVSDAGAPIAFLTYDWHDREVKAITLPGRDEQMTEEIRRTFLDRWVGP